MTTPDVFIIESLDPDDEGNGRFEGGVISHVLRLHEKNPRYTYVRTRSKFLDAVHEFGDSEYRYLHISSHGNEIGMYTTNQDEISYKEMGEILTPVLTKKRLFLSACSMTNERMAQNIIPITGCTSVIGPTEEISFSDAAVFWPAVYHLVFSHNRQSIDKQTLKRNLKRVGATFDVSMGYFANSRKHGYRRVL